MNAANGDEIPNWDAEKIQALVHERFQKRPCWFQIQIALALYNEKDVIAVAPTGAGKTLSFWIPMLMTLADGKLNKMTFVVTPLTLLGKQNQRELEDAGLKGIALSSENSTDEVFKVCLIYEFINRLAETMTGH
jgi:superfamily II DNA helicase RecQ